MSTQLIANPTGAFQGGPTAPIPFDGAASFEYVDAVNTGQLASATAYGALPIHQGDIVSVTQIKETTNNQYQFGVCQTPFTAAGAIPADFTNAGNPMIGVALDPIGFSGFATGRVLVRGVALAVAGSTATVGQLVQAHTSLNGQFIGATTGGAAFAQTAQPGLNIGMVISNNPALSPNTTTLLRWSGITVLACTFTSGSATVTTTNNFNTAGVLAGMTIVASSSTTSTLNGLPILPPGTTVSSIQSATSLTLSANALASVTETTAGAVFNAVPTPTTFTLGVTAGNASFILVQKF